LVQQQEERVKGAKARLRWNKTDDVNENNWIGLKHFYYRFNQAQTILKDIRTGLKN
jgi:alpha/beta superfamily hydrolase